MSSLTLTLVAAAASLGSVHTVAPDHWMPFAALARAERWSARRTAVITALCGIGHVTVSVLLGLVSVFLGLESPDESLRRRNGKFACSNALVEDTIQRALAHGCRTLDVFFMVGLPHQTYADALGIADYCEHLLERFGAGGRLRPYVAPLAPFLDPGSRALEHPELGVTLFCRTLEDHRQACLQNGWQRVLSYETGAMTRDQIAAATYEVATRLNAVKHRCGLIDDQTYEGVEYRLGVAREVLKGEGPFDARRIDLANHATMFGDDELKAPLPRRFRVGATLLWNLAAGLALEVGHTAARMSGRYDVAVTRARP